MSNDRADKLIRLVTEYLPLGDEDVEVIIAGHDDGGAHIWAIHNDIARCHDVEGFACIGAGADHADSQLRFAGFTRNSGPQEALVLAYLAKRRAEMAPGVGKMTDIHIRGTDLRAVPLLDNWMEKLQDEYRKFADAEQSALKGAIASATATVQSLADAPTLPPTAPSTPIVQDPTEPKPDTPPPPRE